MVGIQIGKEQEERKREEEGLNFETTPWWNFRNHHGLCGRRAAEREFVKFVKLRAQPTAKAMMHRGGSMMHRGQLISSHRAGGTTFLHPRMHTYTQSRF